VPEIVGGRRDSDGRPMVHTYSYPAEQYDEGLVDRLAEHCRAEWGEIEMHYGMLAPNTPENTRWEVTHFRDVSAECGRLSYWQGSDAPRYALVHGNFALSNSAGAAVEWIRKSRFWRKQVTAPTLRFRRRRFTAEIAKINWIYECTPPLDRKAPDRRGRDLRRGHPRPLFRCWSRGRCYRISAEAGLFPRASRTAPSPARGRPGCGGSPWKRAAIAAHGRPDWIFVKLHCQGMDPRPKNQDAVLGTSMRKFLH